MYYLSKRIVHNQTIARRTIFCSRGTVDVGAFFFWLLVGDWIIFFEGESRSTDANSVSVSSRYIVRIEST